MTSFRSRLVALLAAAVLAAPALAAVQAGRGQPQPAQTLPGGATQLQETHGEWRVTCAQPSGQKVCTLSQQLADQNSRQMVLGIELKTATADKADGTLVMPF